MIVGTAGHIDHGKTTLVRALTGVDTDRLPEEKARGVSIELGYAFLDAPQGRRIGFVDVPGHERLVHTMLAGATGIDHALLLVAADDGVMPQTREHLAVLSLLGMSQGTVAITKSDRVEPARVQEVAGQARALLADTPLADAPVLPLSAHTGSGLEALRSRLFEAAASAPPHPRLGQGFRLAVDRVFSLDGAGTVVTGTVHAGVVRVGDEVMQVPGRRVARVRSLHAQNRAVSEARAGERCAMALVGMDREALQRGQWLVGQGLYSASDRIDVELQLWHGEDRVLRSGTPVHVHLGSEAVTGTVALLDPPVLEPGQRARAQLVLRAPVGAWHGDRVVLRDASASRTLAGGQVLDAAAPVRYRRTPQRLAELQALGHPLPAERLNALLANAPHGLELRRWAATQGQDLVGLMADLHADLLRQRDGEHEWLLHPAHRAPAEQRLVEVLAQYHQTHPQELGPDSARLRRLALPRLPEPLWRGLLARMQQQGQIGVRGAFVHLPDHGIRLSATEERLAQTVAPLLSAAGFDGAWVRDLARDSGEPESLLRVTLARLAQRAELHQVVKDLYYPPATVHELARRVREVAAAQGGAVTAAAYRDATQLGRKRAIQILEHFDRIGLLRRVHDVHWLRTDCRLFMDAE